MHDAALVGDGKYRAELVQQQQAVPSEHMDLLTQGTGAHPSAYRANRRALRG